jgi:hypothetical protein
MLNAFTMTAATAVDQHTERFFTLRRIEGEAAEALAHAMADTGDQLLQIGSEISNKGEKGWQIWLARQAREARIRGLEPITDRTSRNYMSLARFRATAGKRFPELMHLSVACLYPILTLPERDLADIAANGVPMRDGTRKPLADATARDLKLAASDLRATTKGVAPHAEPTDPFEKAMKLLQGLELTDAQRAKLAEVIGLQPAPPAPLTPPEPRSLPKDLLDVEKAPVAPVAPKSPPLENVFQSLPNVMRALGQLGSLR